MLTPCPQCGAPQRPDARFCTHCGAALPPSPTGATSQVSAPVGLALPAFTPQPRDWWQLGGLGLLLLSTGLPWVGLPGGVSLGPPQLGGWLAVLIVLGLADAALVAWPAWRPVAWPSVQRFLSAALWGAVVMIGILLWTTERLLTHLVQHLTSANDVFLGSLFGSLQVGPSLLTLQVGFLCALVGASAWVAGAWRRAA